MDNDQLSDAHAKGCFVLIVVAVIMGLVMWKACSSGPATPATPNPQAEAETAKTMAEKFVLDKLVAPATAKFSPSDETAATQTRDGAWAVKGWVDAQNRYGAFIRHIYLVSLKNVGNVGEKRWEA